MGLPGPMVANTCAASVELVSNRLAPGVVPESATLLPQKNTSEAANPVLELKPPNASFPSTITSSQVLRIAPSFHTRCTRSEPPTPAPGRTISDVGAGATAQVCGALLFPRRK